MYSLFFLVMSTRTETPQVLGLPQVPASGSVMGAPFNSLICRVKNWSAKDLAEISSLFWMKADWLELIGLLSALQLL